MRPSQYYPIINIAIVWCIISDIGPIFIFDAPKKTFGQDSIILKERISSVQDGCVMKSVCRHFDTGNFFLNKVLTKLLLSAFHSAFSQVALKLQHSRGFPEYIRQPSKGPNRRSEIQTLNRKSPRGASREVVTSSQKLKRFGSGVTFAVNKFGPNLLIPNCLLEDELQVLISWHLFESNPSVLFLLKVIIIPSKDLPAFHCCWCIASGIFRPSPSHINSFTRIIRTYVCTTIVSLFCILLVVGEYSIAASWSTKCLKRMSIWVFSTKMKILQKMSPVSYFKVKVILISFPLLVQGRLTKADRGNNYFCPQPSGFFLFPL